MKTKIFKFIVPVFAIIMAIGLASATVAPFEANQTAYYNHPILGLQSTTVGSECGPSGATGCMYNGYQLYQEPGLINEFRKN